MWTWNAAAFFKVVTLHESINSLVYIVAKSPELHIQSIHSGENADFYPIESYVKQ